MTTTADTHNIAKNCLYDVQEELGDKFDSTVREIEAQLDALIQERDEAIEIISDKCDEAIERFEEELKQLKDKLYDRR